MASALKKLNPEQRKKLIFHVGVFLMLFIVFFCYTSRNLYVDKHAEQVFWEKLFSEDQLNSSHHENEVLTGVYVENLSDISLKDSSYLIELMIWFKWNGDEKLDPMDNFRLYKGDILSKEVIKTEQKANINYQLIRCKVKIAKTFWTKRFPLESHQLKFYIESNLPIEQMTFIPDRQNSEINKDMDIADYKIKQFAVSSRNQTYHNNHGDPQFKQKITTSELVGGIEINRKGAGLYIKCFIALFGTIVWVMITLFLSVFHEIDPLGMIPGALFGAVSNIMIGASLLPDVLQLGLLEYINIFGISIIIAVTISIININRIKSKHKDRDFAYVYGRTMFHLILAATLIVNVGFPLIAYNF
ncbi:hypothetical protein [Listeria ilorinensis]|uniref:hypothetical protein n=1 Tax=Listeria ilorinensis TaxID=2867439 RepID=UPI001EF69FDA|nr:hypothetical protein [Listeria ilorinensis]